MIAILLILLAGGIALAVSFALSFTAVSFYILWKRRNRPKYCYAEPAEPVPVRKGADVGRIEPSSLIDSKSALLTWSRHESDH